jgi:hypothetical protein
MDTGIGVMEVVDSRSKCMFDDRSGQGDLGVCVYGSNNIKGKKEDRHQYRFYTST